MHWAVVREDGAAVIEPRVHIEALDTRGLSRPVRLAILRAQLTLLRMRAEHGIPISVEVLARTEQLARTLELYEVAA